MLRGAVAFTLVSSFILSGVMFYLAFRYVPRRPMRPRAALAGALLGTVLWEIAKQLFRIYIREVGVYEKHARLDGAWRDVVVVERLIPANL